jgi:hypothetical protein
MPTEDTDLYGRYGFKEFFGHHRLSEIGNASNTFRFCVLRAFRGPLFRNLGSCSRKSGPKHPLAATPCHHPSPDTRTSTDTPNACLHFRVHHLILSNRVMLLSSLTPDDQALLALLPH